MSFRTLFEFVLPLAAFFIFSIITIILSIEKEFKSKDTRPEEKSMMKLLLITIFAFIFIALTVGKNRIINYTALFIPACIIIIMTTRNIKNNQDTNN